MKNWKRFIAACLSVTMVASTPLTTFAEASVSAMDLVPKVNKESTTETQDETDFEKILSHEKPYEYFSGLENQKGILDACKDEELFQLKEYMKYAYIHESDLKNRQSLDAYLLISETWRNRKVTFKKEEQEQLLQFLENTKVYGTRYKDGEKEKSVKDFPTYMEYLKSIKKFDVPRYVELLSAFDEAKTEDDLAKAMEAFTNFEEEIYGFDEQKDEKTDSKSMSNERKGNASIKESEKLLESIIKDDDAYATLDIKKLPEQLQKLTPEHLYIGMIWARYSFLDECALLHSSEDVYLSFVDAWMKLAIQTQKEVLAKKSELEKKSFSYFHASKEYYSSYDSYVTCRDESTYASLDTILKKACELETPKNEKEYSVSRKNFQVYLQKLNSSSLLKEQKNSDNKEISTYSLSKAVQGVDTKDIFKINFHDYEGDLQSLVPKSDNIHKKPINAGRPFTFQFFEDDMAAYPGTGIDTETGVGGSRWWNNYAEAPAKNPPKKYQKGIVDNVLHNGYPVLSKTTDYYGYSLDYLFNNGTAAGVKANYQNVNKLFMQNSNGDYYLDSDTDYTVLESNGEVTHYPVAEGDGIFVPLSEIAYGSQSANNFWFGMDITANFTIPEDRRVNGRDMIYEFSGDDDMWVFIDDVLVLDIGGVHSAISGNINFTTGKVTEEWRARNFDGQMEGGEIYHTIEESFRNAGKKWDNSVGSQHTMKIFYLERGNGASTCKMKFNIPFVPIEPEEPDYQIDYNANGGIGTMTGDTVKYGQSYVPKQNGFTKTGYKFTGWNTEKNGTGESWTPGQSKTFNHKEDIVLYAQWQTSSYNVVYKPNGGNGNDQTQTTNHGSSWTTKGDIFNKTGYILTSWNTQSDGTGTRYSLNTNQGAWNRTSDLVLYAQWTPNTYIVKYNGNGATGGSTASSTHTFDVAKALTANGFTRTGYTFKEWNTKADGSGTSYTNKQSVKNLTTVNGSTVTLYAQWTPNTYTVTYDGNGAISGNTYDSFHTYGIAKALSPNGYSKIGYTFSGWNTRADGSGTSYSDREVVKNLTTVNGSIVTLYAQWTPNTYTVTYDGNGSTSGYTYDSFHTYDVAKALSPNGYTKTGHTFKGWNTRADGSGTSYTNKQSVKNLTTVNGGIVTLYAQWTPNTYTVQYDGNGSTSGYTYDSFHTYDVAKALSPNGYTKTGYTFSGWNTRADGSGTSYSDREVVKNLTTVNGGIVTLYAQWTSNAYTVKYDGNGATSGSTASSTHTFDVAKALTTNGFTRTGYTFKGWNTRADGSGTSYADKQSVKNLTAINGATVTLYAQWTPHTLTVRYHLNGGKDVPGDTIFNNSDPASVVTYTYPETTGQNGLLDITTARVTPPTGYLIEGHWNTTPDGKGTSFDFTTKYTLAQLNKQVETGNAVVDLYAQWTPKKLVTTFHRNNGATDTTTAKQTFVYDVAGQKFSDKKWTRTGYTLIGWADSKTATTQQYAILNSVSNAWIDKYAPANDVYAVWKVNTYTIQYDGNGATGGSTPSSHHTYDKPQTLTPNGFEKDGYYFDSWNTEPDGTGKTYQDKEEVKNLTSKDKDMVTLYAQWKPVDYKVVYKGNGSTSGTEKTHLFNQREIEANGYAVKANKGYTDFVRTNHAFVGWYQNSVVNTKADMNKIYKQGSKLTYSQLLAVHAEQVKKGLVKDTDPKVKNIILYAVWDEVPDLDTSGMKKSQFYEGVDVTHTDLLNGITANDKIDGSLTNQIIITRIDYSAGKLVDGKKHPVYSQTWTNGMPADAKLDTWFMQLDKNDSPVTHTVTYQVKDSAGNITTAKKNIQVIYNEFPVIKATEFQFELKDAQTGKITKDILLEQAIANGLVSASDVEDGDMKSKIELIDYDANAFKTMKQEGFIPITYRVQDSMGPGGKGKVTLKTVNVNIFIRYKEETVRYVRFINKEYYEKNANLDRNALSGKYDQIALLSANGGLHPFSVWYTKPEYRTLITETFDKTSGTTYVYTKDDITKMREFVKQHGVGNAKEENALSEFADIFMTGDFILK